LHNASGGVHHPLVPMGIVPLTSVPEIPIWSPGYMQVKGKLFKRSTPNVRVIHVLKQIKQKYMVLILCNAACFS